MKKRLVATMLVASMAFSMVACGSKTQDSVGDAAEAVVESAQSDQISGSTIEYNPFDYVTLGQYENLEVEIDLTYPTVESYLQEMLTNAGINEYVEDPEQTEIKEDSIVNLNYKGIKDGEAFQGGTAEDQMIDIEADASRYIDGFVSGLIGHKVGEEFGNEVTFPENYGSAELAGQTVIFEFKINYIAKPVDINSLTAEQLETLGFGTQEELMEAAKAGQESGNAAKASENLMTAVGQAITDNCTCDSLPDGLLDATYEKVYAYYVDNYTSEETSLEDFVAYYGQTVEDFEKGIRSQAESYLKVQLIFEAIAKEMGIEVSEEEYQTFITDLCTSNGLEEPTELYRYYGSVSGDGEEYLRNVYRNKIVLEKCSETATATNM